MTALVDIANGRGLVAYVEKHLNRYASNLGKALEQGEAESVHDVRVASRRLTEPMRLIGGWVGRQETRKAIRRLRRVRRTLRKTRELDVLQASVAQSARDLAGLDASGLAQLEGILTQQRERSLTQARRRCAGSSGKGVEALVRQLVADFEQRVDRDTELLVAQEVERLFERWARRLLELDPRSSETDLHETRLCAKRLRYSAELMRDVGNRDNAALFQTLVEIQDVLGSWSDRLAAARCISAIARRRRVLAMQSAWAEALLRYSARMAQAATDDRSRIVEKWPQVHAAVLSALSDRCAAPSAGPGKRANEPV